MKKKCSYCFYYDVCQGKKYCRYFDPVVNNDEFENEHIIVLLERQRRQYAKEWDKYIEQFEFD